MRLCMGMPGKIIPIDHYLLSLHPFKQSIYMPSMKEHSVIPYHSDLYEEYEKSTFGAVLSRSLKLGHICSDGHI
jgi:hypothetical protein